MTASEPPCSIPGPSTQHEKPLASEGSEAGAVADPHRWAMLAGTWLIYVCFGLITASMAPLTSMVEPLGTWQ